MNKTMNKRVKGWGIVGATLEDLVYTTDEKTQTFPFLIFDDKKEARKYLDKLIRGFIAVPVTITIHLPKKK